MTKSIKQIKQELDDTKSAVAETAVELQDRYRNYLDQLSQSVKQQLILASYQICTEFYPQPFLNLSLSNKQDLQQTLRRIGIDLQPELLSIIEQQELEPEGDELNLMAELIKNLPKAKTKQKAHEGIDIETENEEDSPEIDLESLKADLANIELIEIEALDESENEELKQLIKGDSEEKIEATPQASPKEKIQLDNPKHLLRWYKQIERKIKKNLDQASKKANKQLQDSGVIPDHIPAKIIDVAMQTETGKRGRSNQKLPNAPNILHLTIETETGKKSKIPQNSSQISLLRIRLAEIEFSDPMLNAQRGQIRNLVNKINKLNSKYKANEQQLAVAEAQAAWRSSWYED